MCVLVCPECPAGEAVSRPATRAGAEGAWTWHPGELLEGGNEPA